MLCFPNCKINIGLFITNKREDGYHDLETVFFPIPWKDVLEIIPTTSESKMVLSGKEVWGDTHNNLIWKAYKLLQKDFSEKITSLQIFLHKVIPMGAGLGGGSSDGTFMLRLLNDFFQLQLSKERLAEYALKLGSDCPFFIYNTPQFAIGRGEKMEAVNIDLSAYSIQLVCADVHVSTSNAFQLITPKPASFNLSEIEQLPIEKWREHIKNDFEEPVFKQHPVLKEIKENLYKAGAIYASMSGSGATVFAIFPKGKKAQFDLSVPFDSHFVE